MGSHKLLSSSDFWEIIQQCIQVGNLCLTFDRFPLCVELFHFSFPKPFFPLTTQTESDRWDRHKTRIAYYLNDRISISILRNWYPGTGPLSSRTLNWFCMDQGPSLSPFRPPYVSVTDLMPLDTKCLMILVPVPTYLCVEGFRYTGTSLINIPTNMSA